jgi:hypothetical protein
MSLPNITLASSVRYGAYKAHLNNALFLIDVLTEGFCKIPRYIKLPKNLTINFRPVRNAYGRAFFTKAVPPSAAAREYIVEVDVRQDIVTFKDTILHELVHIEQFYQGRLRDAGPMHFKWNGKKMLIDASSLDIYNNLPWEIEANTRAKFLSELVF